MNTVDHRSLGLLGLATICAYGCWYYAFGVLLDPIRLDTGWSESSLASSFAAGSVLVGLSSFAGGRLLDLAGHRVVLGLGGLIGSSGLLLASFAETYVVFFVGAATGFGALGAFGFYHISMTTAVRLNPGNPKRAIAELTLWGALASAVYLPLAGWLVEIMSWRDTVRVLSLTSGAVMIVAAVVLPSAEAPAPEDGVDTPARPPLGEVLRATIAPSGPRSFTVAIAFGGVAMSTMLVYQVPVMTSIGLPAATAATMAGLRGICQIGGRLPLSPVVARLGSDRALVLAFCAIATGGALLAISDNVAIAATFAVVAGLGVGAFSPLQGMKSEELFDRSVLGATMGFYSSVLQLAGSVGPVVASVTSEAAGNRRWVCLIISVAALLAAAATWHSDADRRAGEPRLAG